MNNTLSILTVLALVPAGVAAQHQHGASPYADLVIDSTVTMLVEEAEALRQGEGMGLALSAELNGYPGPRHALEMASGLGLSSAQVEDLERIRSEMTAAAVRAGEQVLRTEAALTTLFREGRATTEAVAALTAEIGEEQGRLRSIHLAAHVQTYVVLTPEQRLAYDRHRGYRTP